MNNLIATITDVIAALPAYLWAHPGILVIGAALCATAGATAHHYLKKG